MFQSKKKLDVEFRRKAFKLTYQLYQCLPQNSKNCFFLIHYIVNKYILYEST